jgi:hypothetical protein
MRTLLLVMLLGACSPPPPPPDAGTPDGGTPDAGAPDSGQVPMTATMGLFATIGPDAGQRLEAFVSVHAAITHDYDDGTCTADRVRPKDADAAWLRMSGYTAPGQPIVCMNEDGGYVCRLPSGAEVTGPPWLASTSDPLGTGTILFATGGGADVGPATVSGSATQTLSVQEDLSTLPPTFHVSCTDGCPSSRVLVKLRGEGGSVDCDFPYAPQLTLPDGALAVLSGPVWISVVRISATTLQGDDHRGALLIGQVGRGVWAYRK